MKKRGILTVGLIAATLALTSCDINELLHQNYVNPVPGGFTANTLPASVSE